MDSSWNPKKKQDILQELPGNKKTCPSDPRYQNCNVTNWCFATFCDYHKCKGLLGEGNECCNEFKKIYTSICPNDWVRRWEDQMQIGTFPVDFPQGIKTPPRKPLY